jgi:hypothetical protein
MFVDTKDNDMSFLERDKEDFEQEGQKEDDPPGQAQARHNQPAAEYIHRYVLKKEGCLPQPMRPLSWSPHRNG